MLRLNFIVPLLVLTAHISAYCSLVYASAQDTFVFKARISEDKGSLDWGHGEVNSLIVQQLMHGLTRSNINGQTVPGLARRWTYENNNKRIRFFIRKDAIWSDGVPVCADHFVYAWKRALTPPVSSPYGHYFDFIKGAKELRMNSLQTNKPTLMASTHGCHELVVELTKPGSIAHHIISHWVFMPMRKDLISKYGNKAFMPKHLVVTGPYKLKSWLPDQKYVLSTNASYYGQRPKIPHVEFVIVPEDLTALNLFNTGKLHWMKDLPSSEVMSSRSKNTFHVQPSAVGYFLGFNTEIPPFNNLDVRCAILSALNTNEIPKILSGLEISANMHFVPPILLNNHKNKNYIPKKNSINLGKQALSKFLQEGHELPNIEFYSKDIHIPLMTWVQERLNKKFNTNFHLQVNDGKSYWKKLETNPPGLFLSGTTAWFNHPYSFLSELASDSVANWGHYSSKIYDLKSEASLQTKSHKELLKMVHAAENILIKKDCAIVPLYFRQTAELLSEKCHDIKLNLLGTLDLNAAHCTL